MGTEFALMKPNGEQFEMGKTRSGFNIGLGAMLDTEEWKRLPGSRKLCAALLDGAEHGSFSPEVNVEGLCAMLADRMVAWAGSSPLRMVYDYSEGYNYRLFTGSRFDPDHSVCQNRKTFPLNGITLLVGADKYPVKAKVMSGDELWLFNEKAGINLFVERATVQQMDRFLKEEFEI